MATPIPKNAAETTPLSAARATGGTVIRGGDVRACGIVSDTRAIRSGEAFVALRGEHHDGHAFVGDAVARGARLLIVEDESVIPESVAAVRVDDTLRAWGALARAHLGRWRSQNPSTRVVAITGSAGKTTTKQLCAALLAQVAPTLASAGNLNNLVGVPAVLFGLESTHRFAVVECGMSTRGEIAALGSLVQPDVGVITNVSVAHAEGVGGTLADVAREKAALFDAIREGGTCVFDADDELCTALAARCPARKVGFGRSDKATYRLLDRTAHGLDGSRVTIATASRHVTVDLPFAGPAAALDLCAALAAAEAVAEGLSDDVTSRAMKGVRNVGGRATVHHLPGGALVIDDSYNANPASMRAAFAMLADVTGRRRVVVLGEMKELGAAAEPEHVALAQTVANARVDLLIGCGGLVHRTVAHARELGVEAIDCDDVAAAARAAAERLRDGDVVLVKGSRSVGTEHVVAVLRGSR